MKEKPIASVHIHKAHEMTSAQRKEIAGWLKDQAKQLLKDGDEYATRFTAGFYWTWQSDKIKIKGDSR